MSPPANIAHYHLTTKLGEGGMGAVYRATDTKLHREVAVKILPDAFAADPDRLARFTREAQVLASLNHPHIAAIYGVEERALILELVHGETLRGPLPLPAALDYARQIAEALEAAHEKGIVHRDLKPGNIMVTPDGVVKVLDFGLAAIASQGADPGANPNNSPTLTMRATQMGVIVGTAAYMSPEQASAKSVDKRSDIWSFGVVLFEVLTGQRLFEGETISHTLAGVLTGPIDLAPLPKETPKAIRDLLRRCLERDVKLRLRDIGEARIAIQQCLAHPEPESPPPAPSGRALLPWAVAALFGVAAAFALWSARTASISLANIQQFSIVLPETDPLPSDFDSSQGQLFAVAPDGSRLVYVCVHGDTPRLCMRPMDRLEIKPLPGTDGAGNPFFSADSKWVGFFAEGKIKKIAVNGGSPVVISDAGRDALAAEWGGDGLITFNPGFTAGIARMSADGGKIESLLKPEAARNESSFIWPQALPDSLLFTVGRDSIASFNDGQIFLARLAPGGTKSPITGGTHARYLPTGHLVYVYAGSLLAARFDPGQGKLLGQGVPVVDGVQTAASSGVAQFAYSQTGTLAYLPGGISEGHSRIALVARNGTEDRTIDTNLQVSEISLSPDGRRVALRAVKANDDIHILDIAAGTFPRFTFEGGDEQSPAWTPDGSRIVYSSARGAPPSIWWKAADGSTAPELLTRGDTARFPSSISPDGKSLVFTEINPVTGADLWLLPLGGSAAAEAKPWIRTPFDEAQPAFSPDGRWVAYTSNDSGGIQVFVVHFPDGNLRRQISNSGGNEPLWAASGKELFYRSGDKLMAVDVATTPSFRAGTPHALFEWKYQPSDSKWGYGVMPDGKHFVFVKPTPAPPARQIHVVLNWFEDLKRRVP